LVLFDPSGTAHSGNALTGLATAARAAGLDVTVHAPAALAGDAGHPGVRWIDVEVGAVLADRRSRTAHRKALVRALDDAGTGVLCDLGLGRTVKSRGSRLPATGRAAFVCHQTNHIDPVDGTGAEAREVERCRAVLREIGARGGHVIAHTEVARARVAELVPPEQVHLLGWPVVHADAACLAPAWRPDPDGVTLLFAGSARLQKGLATLLDAAAGVTGFDRLVVPGRLPPRLRGRLELGDPRLDLWDRWLDPAEYQGAFARASLVVLPYQRAYLERGTYSSVMAEAMAHGRPLVVSEPLAPLLPPGYRGAVVADAETTAGLAAGLDRALSELDALEEVAMTEGREHVRRDHTYEGYLDAVLRVCGAAAGAGHPGA
jgi:glycosyltransferase involved in cell wall biosynthesis